MANDMSWLDEVLDPAQDGVLEEPFPWHLGVYDAHCHPTDTPSCLESIPAIKARALTIMATRGEDQDVVASFARRFGLSPALAVELLEGRTPDQCRLVPSFGWHPWFSHQLYDDATLGSRHAIGESEKIQHYKNVITPVPEDDDFLRYFPDPRPLSGLLAEIRGYLQQFPYALVGEIGLDRTFRLPENWLPNVHTESSDGATPGGREGRRLSPYRVQVDHQRKVLMAQLNLAGEMQRPVSVHGVAAHGILFETLRETWKGYEKEVLSKREQKQRANAVKIKAEEEETESSSSMASPQPFPPRICLHSYSGPPDTLRQYFHPSIPTEIYCSFSVLVNLKSSTARKTVDVIRAVPDHRILVESDLHCAGDRMEALLEQMVRCVCKAKEWSLEEGVKQLASNWFRFLFGRESGLSEGGKTPDISRNDRELDEEKKAKLTEFKKALEDDNMEEALRLYGETDNELTTIGRTLLSKFKAQDERTSPS